MENKILEKVEYTRVDGGCKTATERIVKETALTIRIDGKHYATAMILAGLEKEYVYGHLLAQGLIQGVRDIRSLTIRNNTAEVKLATNGRKVLQNKKVKSKHKVKTTDIFNCVKAILKSEVFSATEAVHSAGLFLNGSEAICIAEDLGRHNALDKVIGYGLLHNVDLSQTLAASTGRQPSEMMVKCRNVNIPIIATKGVPTTIAIEIAEKAGITIAGLVRGKNMIVYSHPERIE
ncbi:MAG: formate dehydrogenase accessory sulfurtransferase FdhD [Dehalococcoidales bacterium]